MPSEESREAVRLLAPPGRRDHAGGANALFRRLTRVRAMLRTRWRAIFVMLAVGVLASGGVRAASDEEELVRVRKEIVKMIGDPFCTNLVYCRVLALGVKSCGKPDEYLAYSNVSGTNTELLETKAAEYAFLQEEVLSARPQSGECVLPKKPDVRCVDQRCKLVP